MFSTRDSFRRLGWVLIGAASLCAGSGCAFQQNYPPEPSDTEIVMTDQAMMHRVWERSHAEYSNLYTIAGPLGDPIHPKEDMPDSQRLVVEPALFLTNTIILPYTLIIAYRPWSEVLYRGDAYEPTYTGNGAQLVSGVILPPEAATPGGIDVETPTPPAPANETPMKDEPMPHSQAPADTPKEPAPTEQAAPATQG